MAEEISEAEVFTAHALQDHREKPGVEAAHQKRGRNRAEGNGHQRGRKENRQVAGPHAQAIGETPADAKGGRNSL